MYYSYVRGQLQIPGGIATLGHYGKTHLLLAACSIATIKLLPHIDSVHLDEDEWIEPWTRDSKILHIELRRWATRQSRHRPNVCESVGQGDRRPLR
jgi:hypothetical protein